MMQVGDRLQLNGFSYIVTAKPYRITSEDEARLDSAVDSEYILGELIIPVDCGGAVYEHEL